MKTLSKIEIEDYEMISSAEYVNWDYFKNKTILVTGATGLIGGNIINALLYASEKRGLGIKIVGIIRNPAKAEETLTLNDNVKLINSSIETLTEIEGKIDCIIHAASPTSSKSFIETPVDVINTNYTGTKNMLEIAREKSVSSFVYLSTMEVYGSPKVEGLISEGGANNINSMDVRSSYPEVKRLCENLCACYGSQYGVPAKVVRLTQTFGPGVLKNDTRVFAEFALDCINKKDIVLKTAGRSKRSYLYTADAVSAILAVLANGENGQAYNVANPETYCSIVEMAKMVAEENACGTIKFTICENSADAAKFSPEHFTNLNVSKLEALGWKPTKNLKEMYDRLIESLKN